MSFSIGSVAAITRAIDSTRNWIESVQDAVGFDQVLARGDEAINAETSAPESTESLLGRTIDAIRRHLGGHGFKPSGAIALTTRADGLVRLETPSDQGAAMEASLAADPKVVQLAARLHARLGPTQIWVGPESPTSPHTEASIVDLTPNSRAANIASEPGGYPNW